MTDAVQVASRQDLERWLKGRPREWAVAVAVRSALRVLPLSGGPVVAKSLSPKRIMDLIFVTLRATLVSSAAAVGPADDTFAASAAAASSAAASASSAAAAYAAAASAAAAYAASSAADAAAADAAAWRAVSSDLASLAGVPSDAAVPALLHSPLWPAADGPPDWVRSGWQALARRRALRNAGFAPWFAWYGALLAGTEDPFGPELTRRIARQPDAWWDRGAKAVNADIAAWLAERATVDAVPPQVPAAFRFQDQGARIGIAPLGTPADDMAAAQAFLDELRDRAAQACERLDSARNAVPFLAAEVERLRDFLPVTAAEVNPFLLRCRLASVDAAVVTLQTAGAAREIGDDAVMQVTGLAVIGRELQHCFPDLRTREREEVRRDVAGREADIAAGLDIVPAAAREATAVVTADARNALDTVTRLDQEAAAAGNSLDPMVRQERLVERVLVKRNFLIQLARLGQRAVDGAWDRLPDRADPAIRAAVVIGLGALIERFTSKGFGKAFTLAGYDRIEDALKILKPKLDEARKTAETKRDAG